MQRIYISIRDIRNRDWVGMHYAWTVLVDRIGINVPESGDIEQIAIDEIDNAFFSAKDNDHIGFVRYSTDSAKPSITDLAWAVFDKADFSDRAPTPFMQSINW